MLSRFLFASSTFTSLQTFSSIGRFARNIYRQFIHGTVYRVVTRILKEHRIAVQSSSILRHSNYHGISFALFAPIKVTPRCLRGIDKRSHRRPPVTKDSSENRLSGKITNGATANRGWHCFATELARLPDAKTFLT